MSTRFESGKLFVTPGAFDLIQQFEVNWFQLVLRHRRGDFGELCADDQRANEQAIASGGRILSRYVVSADDGRDGNAPVSLWVITEATDDEGIRRCTTLLCPGEY